MSVTTSIINGTGSQTARLRGIDTLESESIVKLSQRVMAFPKRFNKNVIERANNLLNRLGSAEEH